MGLSLASCVPSSQSGHRHGQARLEGRASCEIFTELLAFFYSNCDQSNTSQLCQPAGVATVKPTHNEAYPPAFNMCSRLVTPNLDSSSKTPIRAASSTNRGPGPLGVGSTPQRTGLQGCQ